MPAKIPYLKPAAVVATGVLMACLSAEEALHGRRHPEPEDQPVPVERMLPPVASLSGIVPGHGPQLEWPPLCGWCGRLSR